jgi:hypothetical protein
MKKQLVSWLLLLGVLLFPTGCHDEYFAKLDELESRTDAVMLYCEQLNASIANLQQLVQAIQKQDMITGITEIKTDNTVTGYRVNFVQHDPITITNGADGKKPLVSSRRDPDDGKYYWAVQYGDSDWIWLKASDGTRMSSVGVLPFVSVKNGMFVITTDNGQTWTELGKADGERGDKMFSDITLFNNYVIITLSTGETLRIPSYEAFLALKADFEKINDNTDAQATLIRSTREKMLWITGVSPLVTDGDTTGLTVSLSNGKSFSIHDWTSAMSPSLFVKRHSDGHLYWAYTIGQSPEKWVLTPEGDKVAAESEAVDIPKVSVVRDTTDGYFYWSVTTKDTTEFLRTKVGNNWEPRAVDTVAKVFSSVRDYTDSLVLVLKDGTTRFVLPKAYTVTFTAPDGTTITDNLVMKDGGEVALRYTANGVNPTLSLLTQGGFSATPGVLESGEACLLIKAPSSFESGTGKIMAFFTFSSGPSPTTVVKTITIIKED